MHRYLDTPMYSPLTLQLRVYFRAATACWTAAVVPAGCCDRTMGSSGTITSSNSSWEMALMVYVSSQRKQMRWAPWRGDLTDANDERADCETCDGVLQQVRRASTQQRRRGAHAGIVVGRLERLAVVVSAAMRFLSTLYSLLTIPSWRCGLLQVLRGKLTIRLGGERLLPHRLLGTCCSPCSVDPQLSIITPQTTPPTHAPLHFTTLLPLLDH
jgi:hypothetical protein